MREERLARTLVELADTLVDDFDVVELLVLLVERSVELLDATAAGLVLADRAGALQHMASTGEPTEALQRFGVEHHEGPCYDCFRAGEPVIVADLSEAAGRWPAFVPMAGDAGLRAAHAFPLRLHGRVLGALNVFMAEPGALTTADVAAGQAMADMAAIALTQVRALHDAQAVTDQLQHALESRVAIEQAKGMLAERAAMGMDEAFSCLRSYARSTKRRLVDVAGEVVSGRLSSDELLSGSLPARRTAPEGQRAG